ncbi:MAG TPA: hypothetical protein PK926_05325 [Spirochaetota bacterium]|nr:hypothetical protein [Spirochaetota bacterium]HPI91140.1 hypothetical protein [Spirochaetota bacterium]HPR47891.1 hypothetical protein [Spirochaetota bacterium]
MIKKILYSGLILLVSVTCLRAEEKPETAQVAKKKVFIYSFVPLDNSGKYQYYSSIIPKTLAKSLKRNEIFNIETTDETFAILPADASGKEKQDYFDRIREANSDYVITGFCEIVENPQVLVNGKNELLLKIKIQVFNLFDQSFDTINLTSREIGVILKDVIDNGTAEIENKLSLYESNRREHMKPSPFLPAHRFFTRFSFGIEVGELFILGKWDDLYNWSQFVSPYFRLNIRDYIGINLSYDYFSTDNDDMDSGTNSTMEIDTIFLGLYYTYRFKRYFDVMVSASGGLSFTYIRFADPSTDDNPYMDPLSDKKSIDPGIITGASIGFHLSCVVLRIGCSYRGYFYADEPFHGMGLYGSLGCNF